MSAQRAGREARGASRRGLPCGRARRELALALGAGAGVLLALVALAYLVPLPERLASASATLVLYEDGSAASLLLAPDGRLRLDPPEEGVDPDYVRALVALEDERFARHPGVDPLAIARAAAQNLRAGRVVSGASTIAMQLARLAEPRPRTLRAKALEALRALQLTLRLGREGVLEAYLRLAPFGGNVEGVEAASWLYFGHSSASLAPVEIATLLAIPQDPNARAPRAGGNPSLARARAELAGRLVARGALELRDDAGQLAALAAAEGALRTPARPPVLPRAAPHAARWLAARHPDARRLATSLERGTQESAERLLAARAPGLRAAGAHNAAIVVIDRREARVRALVGNLDFFDERHGGQVVAFDAPRSPGSALKPLIYALGLERGAILPDELVADVPARFGATTPENFDRDYEGLVPFDEALARSRNVPFFRLLAEVGVERFIATLRVAGAEHLSVRPGHYGLSAAVGALEMTPLELARVYLALASEGRARPLRLLEADAGARGVELVSPGAAWLTLEALRTRGHPDFPLRARLAALPEGIAWKTGTSYGHRDAWAVGVGARHVVVVWLGNVDGRPARGLVGGELAGPLLFDLFDALGERGARPEPAPLDLAPLEVCALSGKRPAAACPHRRTLLAARARVPAERCDFHVALSVDKASGLALDPSCREGREHETRSFVVLPASVARWYAARGRLVPGPPAPAPGCATRASEEGPRIVLPPPRRRIVLVPHRPASEQEQPLVAEAARADETLSWFVDGRLHAQGPARTTQWWTPRPGRHEITLVDEAGRSARRVVEVVEVERVASAREQADAGARAPARTAPAPAPRRGAAGGE